MRLARMLLPAHNLAQPYLLLLAQVGTWYGPFRDASQRRFSRDVWSAGNAIFNYPNTQRSTQLWYHDHVVGITRLNVYAGMAGLYQLRSNDVAAGAELPGLPYPPPGVGFPDSQVRALALHVSSHACCRCLPCVSAAAAICVCRCARSLWRSRTGRLTRTGSCSIPSLTSPPRTLCPTRLCRLSGFLASHQHRVLACTLPGGRRPAQVCCLLACCRVFRHAGRHACERGRRQRARDGRERADLAQMGACAYITLHALADCAGTAA